jgi:membrane-bound inhibitor of C-type lysozyme
MKKLIILIIFIIVLSSAWLIFLNKKNKSTVDTNNSPKKQGSEVNFSCKDNKSINVVFYKGVVITVKPNEPPKPTGSLEIKLSDGREYNLLQTISADGGRYANSDESFVFWNKGNTALVLENNAEKSYIGCIVVAPDPGGLENIYRDSDIGFSIRYPNDYLLNTKYSYQEFGPNKKINGVKFTIPENYSIHTNLSSSDTGVSVEYLTNNNNCNAGLFSPNKVTLKTVNDNSKEYSYAENTEGAAGNRYEEYIWAIPNSNPCIAVRYLIHYTNIENYPTGEVTEFNKTELIKQFDKIRHSLITS